MQEYSPTSPRHQANLWAIDRSNDRVKKDLTQQPDATGEHLVNSSAAWLPRAGKKTKELNSDARPQAYVAGADVPASAASEATSATQIKAPAKLNRERDVAQSKDFVNDKQFLVMKDFSASAKSDSGSKFEASVPKQGGSGGQAFEVKAAEQGVGLKTITTSNETGESKSSGSNEAASAGLAAGIVPQSGKVDSLAASELKTSVLGRSELQTDHLPLQATGATNKVLPLKAEPVKVFEEKDQVAEKQSNLVEYKEKAPETAKQLVAGDDKVWSNHGEAKTENNVAAATPNHVIEENSQENAKQVVPEDNLRITAKTLNGSSGNGQINVIEVNAGIAPVADVESRGNDSDAVFKSKSQDADNFFKTKSSDGQNWNELHKDPTATLTQVKPLSESKGAEALSVSAEKQQPEYAKNVPAGAEVVEAKHRLAADSSFGSGVTARQENTVNKLAETSGGSRESVSEVAKAFSTPRVADGAEPLQYQKHESIDNPAVLAKQPDSREVFAAQSDRTNLHSETIGNAAKIVYPSDELKPAEMSQEKHVAISRQQFQPRLS